MITLGIETSCDETSIAVVADGVVRANAVTSSVHLHKRYGGVVPEIASRYHVEYILEVLEEALASSSVRLGDVELIAVTKGPGLVGALLTGISTAKALSYALGVPLVGVNHVLAHLYSARLNDPSKVHFPFIGLVVSGGHTALFYCKSVGDQKLLGQTQDDAVGEAFDKVAKILGLGYPGGPAVEKAALLATHKDASLFPRTYLGADSLDFSFSGVKTAVLYYVRKLQAQAKREALPVTAVRDIAYAFQEAALDVLVDKTFQAAARKKTSRIVVGGGVAANKRLREKFIEASVRHGAGEFYFPEFKYCLDNAAMVAALGEAMYTQGKRSNLLMNAEPNLAIG